VPVSRYTSKRLAFAPRTAYRRYRSRDLDPVARQLLETHGYGRAIYDFMSAVGQHRDLLTDVHIDEHGVALDLGAFVGSWSKRMAERYGCRVYAFEPSPGPAAKATAELQQFPKVTVLPFALGASDSTSELTRDGPGSSLFGGKGEFGRVDVQVRDIVAVLDELGLEHVDVMKVNIEGAEYDLLDRLAATNWLPRVSTLSVQFHEWHPDAYRRRRRLRRTLRETHDNVWVYPWVWELWTVR
jgi:FkbM family methyltransferase